MVVMVIYDYYPPTWLRQRDKDKITHPGSKPCSVSPRCGTPDKSPRLSEPQCPHLSSGDNNPHLKGLLDEETCMKLPGCWLELKNKQTKPVSCWQAAPRLPWDIANQRTQVKAPGT